jgi:hypothetical protein
MEGLREYRIGEISKYTLAHANDALVWAEDKLAELYKVTYDGPTPKELFLEIHLTFDDIYLIKKRISQLLDAQLDEYYAAGSVVTPWDKKEACKKLIELTKNDPSEWPVRRLTEILYASLCRIPWINRMDVLQDLAAKLEEQGYMYSGDYREFIRECGRYR